MLYFPSLIRNSKAVVYVVATLDGPFPPLSFVSLVHVAPLLIRPFSRRVPFSGAGDLTLSRSTTPDKGHGKQYKRMKQAAKAILIPSFSIYANKRHQS
jgi:hypothetical protein